MDAEFQKEITKLYSDEHSELRKKLVKILGIDEREVQSLIDEIVGKMLILNAKGELNPIKNIDAYIITAVKNEHIKNRKQSERQDESYIGFARINYDDTHIDQLGEEIKSRKTFEKAEKYILNHLEELIPNETDRYILINFHLQGKTYKEIHKDLLEKGIEIKVGALRTRNNRTLERIRDKILVNFPQLERITYS